MIQNYHKHISHHLWDHCETAESGGSAEGNVKYPQPPKYKNIKDSCTPENYDKIYPRWNNQNLNVSKSKILILVDQRDYNICFELDGWTTTIYSWISRLSLGFLCYHQSWTNHSR